MTSTPHAAKDKKVRQEQSKSLEKFIIEITEQSGLKALRD
jgi:hypothetical protein